jgi:CheY-like chemotaxis protein
MVEANIHSLSSRNLIANDTRPKLGGRVEAWRDIGEVLLARAREVTRLINERARRAVGIRRLRILVIEHYRGGLSTFADFFNLFGHEVVFAPTPTIAIAESLQHVPDAVICDISRGGLRYCELAKELREVAASVNGSRPALIALSATGENDTELRLPAGFDYYLTKPADPAAINRLLEQFAGAHSIPSKSQSSESSSHSGRRLVG